jgi:hypothetical protein
MLVVDSSGCGDYEYGEFYDTISASGSCRVRFKTADFGQRMVLHCHVLSHEDNGAMVWMDVQGSGMPENNNNGAQSTCPGTVPAPTTEAPTPAPTTEAPAPATTTEAPTPAPTTEAPVDFCVGRNGPCSSNSECCSGDCKESNRGAKCFGARFLRSDDEGK